MTHFKKLLLVVALLLAVSGGCKPPPPIHDGVIDKMEQEEKDLNRQITEIQEEVRNLLLAMVKEIHDNRIDADQETQKVRASIDKIKALRRKLQQLQPIAKGPVA